MCGGTSVWTVPTPLGWGLSPRVRGNPAGRVVRAHLRGSIPACAGEPASGGAYSYQEMVYPRVCGGTRGS